MARAAATRALQRLQTFEVVDELKQIAWREDLHVGGGPRGLGA
jgi:hypothetical protein